MRFSVRELAAIDLHGARGAVLRRRLIVGEFVLATVLSFGLGGWLVIRGGVAGWLVGGALLGIGANYAALATYSIKLARPTTLQAQIAELGDLPRAQRYYSTAQLRLLIPGLVAVLALLQTRRAP